MAQLKFQQSLHLGLQLKQQLKLTPQLQLAMKMLQLNQLELQELIKQEVEKNPLLEIEAETPSEKSERKDADGSEGTNGQEPPAVEVAQSAGEKTEHGEEFPQEFYKYLMDSSDGSYGEITVNYDPDDESNLEEYVPSRPSLAEHLSVQLRLSSVNEEDRKIGEYLIGMIDRNGYLSFLEDEVLAVLGITKEALDRVVELLQSFDPPGVAARNLRECLSIQYSARKDVDPFVLTLIDLYLEDLANNKLPQVARRERVDIETVKEAYEEIRRLDPKPGLHYSLGSEEKPLYVTPDVFVEIDKEGEIQVTLNDRYVPQLRINRFYQSMLRSEKLQAKKTISFIKERLNAARFILESIDRRRDTIYRVTKRIFEVQRGFLERGVAGLKPLILKDIAEFCELHESTISRVANNKWVQTPRGLFQLKFFFSSGTTRADGQEISSKHVHQIIKKFVDDENPRKPLSDAKIVQMLKDRGIEIARRTVAKYREEMGIRSSSKRKTFT